MAAEAHAQQVKRIAAAWRAALAMSPHPAGCSCMGGFAIPPPSPADFEEDVLNYLRGRYAAAGEADLAGLLARRIAGDPAGKPRFAAWIAALGDGAAANAEDNAVEAKSRARFLDDIEAFLVSYRDETARAAAGGFVCT